MKYGFLEKANFLMTNKIYNLFIKDLFAIKGRASRKEFLARFLMMIILCITGRYFFDVFHSNEDSVLGGISGFAASFILTPILIIYVIQMFFVTHRRLHDLNASGWWQLVTFIPLGQIFMIGFIFFKGTQGVNRFGEVPNEDSESYSSLKYNMFICTGITLLTLAMLYFLVILNRDKEYSVNCQKIGMEYYKKGDYEDALKSFNLAIDFTPNRSTLHIARGLALAKLEQYDEAIKSYDKAIDLTLENERIYNSGVYVSRGKALNKLGRYEEALESVDKTLALNPKNKAAIEVKKQILEFLNKKL